MINQTSEREVMEYKKETSPIVTKAVNLRIEDKDSMTVATEILSQLNKFNDAVKEEKEKVTKPLRAVIKVENDRWKPIESELEKGIASLRIEMSSYQTKAIAQAKIDEDKIANRVGQGKGKLTVETAIKKLGDIEKPEEKVVTTAGSIRFRADKKLKITDLSKIPRVFYVLDEDAVLEALKAGQTIAGAEIEIIQVPINSR